MIKILVLIWMTGMAIINTNAQEGIKIYAHRGASSMAPENTLSSAVLGWKQEADGVEIDIYLTADHRIMVIHDDNTLRTTGSDFRVAEANSETLRKLDAGSWKSPYYQGEKIPFLEEILHAIPVGRSLIIEIKCGSEIIPFLKNVIRDSGRAAQCMIISFNFEALSDAKKVMPEIPAFFLSSDLNAENFNLWLDKIHNAHIDGLDLDYKTITPELATLCRQHHIPLIAWTVDETSIAYELMKMGVSAITTNKPLELRKGLHNK